MRKGLISLVLPSRGRPVRFEEMWRSARDNALQKDLIEAVVWLDEDDPDSYHYPTLDQVMYKVGPRIKISEAWNAAAEFADGEMLMVCADDLMFRTEFWDSRVRREFETFSDRIVLVGVDDGYQDSRYLATHPFVHRNWLNVVGDLVPRYFDAWYVDTWLTEVADMIGRRRMISVLVEHVHPAAGKAPMDKTYEEGIAKTQGMPELYESLRSVREDWASWLRQEIG